MKVLIACEFSGIVRDAFAAQGHDAWSCDLLDTERPNGNHIKGDVRDTLGNGWDIMIAHPPCTHLAVSGAVWFKYKQKEQAEALDFIRLLLNAPIPKIALENPVGVINTKIRKPDQTIQPWMFGDGAQKATCLWLKNLPPLYSTKIVDKGEMYISKNGKKRGGAWTMKLPPSPDRWKIRSRTFQGIADAMAKQWGGNTNQWWGI